jgi:hypothetical protein
LEKTSIIHFQIDFRLDKSKPLRKAQNTTKEEVETTTKDNQSKRNKDKQYQLNNKIKTPQLHRPNKIKKMLQKEKVAEEGQDKVNNDLIFLNKLHIHSFISYRKRIEWKKVYL